MIRFDAMALEHVYVCRGGRTTAEASIDETMEFLHARYGRAGLELKLKVLFGPGMIESGTEGGEISYIDFLEAVNRAQLDTFVNSEQGQALEAIKKKDKK